MKHLDRSDNTIYKFIIGFLASGILICMMILVIMLRPYFDLSKFVFTYIVTPDIQITEIMTSNSEYQDKNGDYSDWIELYNASNFNINIEGYTLRKSGNDKPYVFTKGSIIEKNGYLIVPCDKKKPDKCAPFSLSKNGNDTIFFYNKNSVVCDSVRTISLLPNTVMEKTDENEWAISDDPTPEFKNDYEQYTGFLNDLKSFGCEIVISEVMSKNKGFVFEDDTSDWIEVKNICDYDVDISDYFVSDNLEKPYKKRLPYHILTPHEYYVVKLSKDDFGISNSGEKIVLSGWRGIRQSVLDIPPMPDNYTYSLDAQNNYIITPLYTPNKPNDFKIYEQNDIDNLKITEVSAKNNCGILDMNGDFSDWIEIENIGNIDIDLSNYWITDDNLDIYKHSLPNVLLKPHERTLVFASSKSIEDVGDIACFGLDADGGYVGIYTSNGELVDSLEYGRCDDNVSYCKNDAMDFAYKSDISTPNHTNNMHGYIQYNSSITNESPLVINEVMVANEDYLPQKDGGFYDWIEVKNNTNDVIDLSNYYLSTDLTDEIICFPNITIHPSELFLAICTGDENMVSDKYFNVPFKLSSSGQSIYILDKNNKPIDWMFAYDIPYNWSMGRTKGKNGFYMFQNPTPNIENGVGVRRAHMPVFSKKSGVYNETSMTIELYGDGQIFYTTDGTIPNKSSKIYEKPITINRNTVIRAISYQKSMVQSKVNSQTFILNKQHTLPVLSLSVKHSDMFSDDMGIYVHGNSVNGNYYEDWEKRANLTFIDVDGEGFSIDCGLKMHGGGSRKTDDKKSMKVNFRSKYGQGKLEYDLFGNAPDIFDSLVIRSGEDYRYTIFRSELLSQLAKDANVNALTQSHKYCVLYVNGEYFGIFALMERYDEQYYAQRYGVDKDSVTIIETANLARSPFMEILNYCSSHDMSKAENYEYIASRVDIDILIDWIIFQAYSANTDIPYNVRIIGSSQGDKKWRYCFYDLDWTMRKENPSFERIFEAENRIFALPQYLINNNLFKQKLYDRTIELYENTLSDENVLAKIDEIYNEISDEIADDRAKWGFSMRTYDSKLDNLKQIVGNGRWESLLNSLNYYCSH